MRSQPINFVPAAGFQPKKQKKARNSAEGRMKDVDKARELIKQGHDLYRVALMIGRSREFVRTHCRGLVKDKKPVFIKQHSKNAYDWLPADDEANVVGYYVPSPEELRLRMAEVRYGNFYRISYITPKEKMPLLWTDHAMNEAVAVERFRKEKGTSATILQITIAPKVFDRD